MVDYKGKLLNATICIKPTKRLIQYVSKMNVVPDMPENLRDIIKGRKQNSALVNNATSKSLMTSEDFNTLRQMKMDGNVKLSIDEKESKISQKEVLLTIEDLHWLYDYINNETENSEKCVYLHELLEDVEIVLPKNSKVQRNPVLEKRCQLLKAQQANISYKKMTKDVDNVRNRLPEDTISYQMKEMNKQIIAVFQFIVSVLTGFAFGFMGIEVFIGTLDFGFKLLLGIIFALLVALAELYFLAKKLNEDLQFETLYTQKQKLTKMD